MRRLPLRVIAGVQISGAILGFGVLFREAIPQYGATRPFIVVFAVFLAVCLAGGVELWVGTERGVGLSILAWLPQMLEYGNASGIARLRAGPHLVVGYRQGELTVGYGFEAVIQLITAAPEPYIGFNLVALAALGYLAARGRRPAPTHQVAVPADGAPAV